MVNRGLTDYIRNSLKQGYNPTSIKNYLISQGYNHQDIDASLAAAYSSNPDKGKFFLLIAFTIIFLIAAGGIAYYFSTTNQSSTTFTPPTNTVQVAPKQPDPTPTQRTQRPRPEPKEEPEPIAKSITDSPTLAKDPVIVPTPEQDEEEIQKLMKDIRSINDCETLSEQRDRCILEFSWKKDHVKFCEEIKSEDLMDDCNSRYALRHEEKEHCQKIVNRYDREICDILLRTAQMLREQGTPFTLDPIEGKIHYNPDQALKDLERANEQPVRTSSFTPPITPQLSD